MAIPIYLADIQFGFVPPLHADQMPEIYGRPEYGRIAIILIGSGHGI